jgi:hypothetical protein
MKKKDIEMAKTRRSSAKPKTTKKGWEPAVPGEDDALTKDERSLDIGGSGQFAPGGYYNQRGVTEPEKTLDRIKVPHRNIRKKN